MLLRRLVVVGLVGLISAAANFATAEDAGSPNANYVVGLDGVDFVDPSDAFRDNRFEISMSDGTGPRFSNFSPSPTRAPSEPSDYRRYEVALTARSSNGIDVSFAQRAGLGFNREGDVERETRASEFRLGRLTGSDRNDRRSSAPRWYIFAGSEDEAITWGPSDRNQFGGARSSFSVQDRVEIGDMQAGVTYERDGWQASLAYVQREISVTTGARTFSEDEDFAGFTWTMRH